MKTGTRLAIVLISTSIPLLAVGCSGTGPLTSRTTTIGTLKTSVARLEHENGELKREVAELERDRSKIADRLVQEEATNDELVTKLDDARNVMRGTGNTSAESVASPSKRPTDADRARRTTPAGRAPRKPPFARIPNRIEEDSEALPLPAPSTLPDEDRDYETAPKPRKRRETPGPQSRLERPSRWLSVERDSSALR